VCVCVSVCVCVCVYVCLSVQPSDWTGNYTANGFPSILIVPRLLN